MALCDIRLPTPYNNHEDKKTQEANNDTTKQAKIELNQFDINLPFWNFSAKPFPCSGVLPVLT